MKLGIFAKVLVGLATAWVAIHPILAFIAIVQGLAAAFAGMAGNYMYTSSGALPSFITSLVLNGSALQITGLLYLALVVFYVSHISRSTGTSRAARVIWGIGIIYLPIIAMPAYYLRYTLRAQAPVRELSEIWRGVRDWRSHLRTLGFLTALLAPVIALFALIAIRNLNDAAQTQYAATLELAVLPGPPGGLTAASFSPDGARILTVGAGGTALWDAATGAELAVLSGYGYSNWVTSAAFSPDGTRIVGWNKDGTLQVWDAANGTLVAGLSGSWYWFISAAFSLDGTHVVTMSGDGTLRVWEDMATGAPITELPGHENEVIDAVFSPDGTRIVTTSWDGTARVWDTATGAELVLLGVPIYGVSSAAFSPDGTRIVSGNVDGAAQVWDTATGALVAELRAPEI